MFQPSTRTPNGTVAPSVYLANDGNCYYHSSDGQWVLFGHGLPPEALPVAAQLLLAPGAAFNSGQAFGQPIYNTNGMNATAGPSQISIDPTLLPLPCQNKHELAWLCGGLLVTKTAVKGKGQEREVSASKRSCTKGAANYHSDEIAALLDIIEEELLVSGKGWAKVSSFHREWTKENSFHACADRSLEAKFKQLVKTTKPTGDAECSPVVEHAYTIDSLINEKVGTWNLDDEDIDDHVSGSEASDNSDKENNDEDDAPPSKRPHVMKPAPAQVHTVNLAPAKCMRMFVSAGLETLNRISASLDSTIQAARTSECAAASFQNVQFMSLTQKNYDL